MSNPTPAGPPQLGNTLARPIGKNFLDPRLDAIDLTYYETNVVELDAGLSTPSQINIDAGTDFYWVATTYMVDNGTDTAPEESTVQVPQLLVVITDTGSQRQLMNAPLPLPCIAGPGERPYRLILPRLFRANSIVQFQWTNYAGTQNYFNLYLVMHGFRLPPNTPFNL